jgi:opacity protein-like surface antigen
MAQEIKGFKFLATGIQATALMICNPVFASTMWTSLPDCLRMILAGGSGAAVSFDVGRQQIFPLLNPVADQINIYNTEKKLHLSILLDIFVGAEWTPNPDWALQFGVGYDQPSNYKIKGSFIQGTGFFKYNYEAITRQLLVEGKLLYQVKAGLHPYAFLGLGAGFNKAQDFNSNVPSSLTFTRINEDASKTSFSYSIGAGIDIDVARQVRLGIGYRFADFGGLRLGQALINNAAVPGRLSQPHLYTNLILAQISFLS